MEVYYGSNGNGTTIIYIPYYFAGMSLNGTSFRFRYDFPFLNRLAKSNLNLEDLAKKKNPWHIQRLNIDHKYLDVLLNSIYHESEKRIQNDMEGIVEIAEGDVIENYIREQEYAGVYDDGYSDMDTEEEHKKDKWWDLGLSPPFLKDDFDWSEEGGELD